MRAFESWLRDHMPGLDMGSLHPKFASIKIPSMADVVKFYDTSSAIDAAVRDPGYGLSADKPRIAAAVTLERKADGTNDVEYTIRMPNVSPDYLPESGEAQVKIERFRQQKPFTFLYQ